MERPDKYEKQHYPDWYVQDVDVPRWAVADSLKGDLF
jgi:hypothetical protein